MNGTLAIDLNVRLSMRTTPSSSSSTRAARQYRNNRQLAVRQLPTVGWDHLTAVICPKLRIRCSCSLSSWCVSVARRCSKWCFLGFALAWLVVGGLIAMYFLYNLVIYESDFRYIRPKYAYLLTRRKCFLFISLRSSCLVLLRRTSVPIVSRRRTGDFQPRWAHCVMNSVIWRFR